MRNTMKHDWIAVALFAFALGLCLAAASPAHALFPVHLWSHGYGGGQGYWGDDSSYAIAMDGSGNVFVTGKFAGTLNLGGNDLANAGLSDVFVVKFDAAGEHQWSVRLGGTDIEEAYGIALDGSGNVFVTGYFQGTTNLGGGDLVSAGGTDIFLVKLDGAGVYQWGQRFGGTSNDLGLGVAADASGNVFITGQFNGTANLGGSDLVSAGFNDAFVAKYDASGVHQWSHGFGGAGGETGRSVDTDASGNVIAAGYFQQTVNFGGSDLVSAGSDDIFVAMFNAAGVHQWSHRVGGTSTENCYSVDADETGSVLIAGYFQGTVDFGGGNIVSVGGSDAFVAKYDANFVHQWSRGFGSPGYEWAWSARFDNSGNAWVTGWFQQMMNAGGGNLTSAGSNDIFLAAFDAAGVHLWSGGFGGAGDDRGYGVVADATGAVIAGFFQNTVDFGGGDLVSTYGKDIFVAKFGPEPKAPLITSITDIGNDQGRKVKIRFDRSPLDSVSSTTPILRYVAFRKDKSAPPSGLPSVRPAEVLDLGWTEVGSVGAYTKDSYGIDVPTLGDSTITHGQYYSVFFIRAMTASPATFFDSPPDSGYSLDNLAPGVPGNLVYSAGVLSWSRSTAEDFDHFSVYRSRTDAFASATLLDRCVTPTFAVGTCGCAFYFVTATDVSGNEGQPAMVNALAGGAESSPTYVLSISAYPNPFNPGTTIRYTVPSTGRVRVEVYDARGARVVTLVDDEKGAGAYAEVWSGRDDSDRPVSSGVYFARITKSNDTKSYKLVLLK